MSNASIKEQLQHLGLANTNNGKINKSKKIPTDDKVKAQKPAWLEQAQYGVELLKAYFPHCFKELKDVQPLKIGIKQDLVKELSTRNDVVISDKACMVNSLSYYVNSAAYHKKIVEGNERIDLFGNPAGVVSADEAKYSIECRKTKLQKKQTVSKTPEIKTSDLQL